jgi:hypothetical protein
VSSEVTESNESIAGAADAPAASAAALLPDPPRPVTAEVRRRAWAEPRVRLWWLVAGAVLAASVYFLGSRYYTWRQDLNVIRRGTEVQAFVYSAEGMPIPGRRRPPSVVVELQYEVGGKKYHVEGYLRGRTESFIIQTYVPIRVDPGDPTKWTARTEPESLWMQLLSGLMLLPPAAAFAAVAGWKRARVTRLWREGRAVDAVVMEARQTALAPRSRFVRCAPAEGEDRRVFDVYVPDRAGRVAEGDSVWVLADPGGKRRAVALPWLTSTPAAEVPR